MKLDAVLYVAGTVAAVVLTIAVNVIGAQYFSRSDWTSDALFSLSQASKTTLRDLKEPVEVWVLLGRQDPLAAPMENLLEAYRAETAKLDIHHVDPDHEKTELVAVRNRFGIETAKVEGGREVTDAVVVLAQGSRRWFITATELYAEHDGEVRSREERALTLGLRNVTSEKTEKLCFTLGHGERRLADDGPLGVAHLRQIFEKNNFTLESFALRDDAARAEKTLATCSAVAILDPKSAFREDESARLRTYLLTGGSLFLAVSPFDPQGSSVELSLPALEPVLSPFGIELERTLVVEQDPNRAAPDTNGLEFVATAKLHAISETLVLSSAHPEPPRVMVAAALSLGIHPQLADGEVSVSEILGSSDTSVLRGSVIESPNVPHTRRGPFPIALAAERPRVHTTDAHGPRVVVLGSAEMLSPAHWAAPLSEHGSAFIVENSISWLAARPELVDVPEKGHVKSEIHWTEATRTGVRNYVLVLMPLACALLGLAILLYRKSNERPVKGAK